MTTKQRVKFVIRNGVLAGVMAATLPLGCFITLGLIEWLFDPGFRQIICIPVLVIFSLLAVVVLWQWSLQPD